MKKFIEKQLRKNLQEKPNGTTYTRILMRIYDLFYLRKEHKKQLKYLAEQQPKEETKARRLLNFYKNG